MDKNERKNCGCAMLSVLSSTQTVKDSLLLDFAQREQKCRTINTKIFASVYVVMGKRIRLNEFYAIVQFNRKIVRIAKKLTTTSGFREHISRPVSYTHLTLPTIYSV